MKLIQLNAWGGRLEPQIRDFLAAEKPDIICLQEAISLDMAGSGLFITVENIQAQNDLAYSAFAPVFTFNYMHGQARFGNCVLSRYPAVKSETVFTHQEHKENFAWSEEIANMRNFVCTKLNVDGKDCNVLTHHGFWVREHKNGTRETERQMKLLADYISGLDGPVILTGDFNLAPHSPSLKSLNERLVNLSTKYNLKTTRTELTPKTEVCDYVFVSESVKVEDFYAADKIVSDHKTLVLEFSL